MIHLYHPYKPLPGSSDDAPRVGKSLDVNALNFCRFSLAQIPADGKGKGKEVEAEALLAVPNLVNSELADIYHLPSSKRLHSSLNVSDVPEIRGTRSGLIMSLHLSFRETRLVLVMGFEDGRVELWTCPTGDKAWRGTWDGRLSEDRRWTRLWEGKGHNEAGQFRIDLLSLPGFWQAGSLC